MKPLRISVPASEELAEAVRWYEQKRAGLGGEFFDAVVDVMNLVQANPSIGTPQAPDGRTRRFLVRRFPYNVVYRVRPEDVYVVAVAHGRRRPGYWKHRS